MIAREVVPDLIEQYVDTGKARFVYRDFPLTNIHPNAQKASEAALCAGRLGYFWEMNEHLFATQDEWSGAADPISFFKGYAEELGMDTKTFNDCLDSGQMASTVQNDAMAAQTFGVRATPTFFINDMPIEGGRPIEDLGKLIDYVAAGGGPPEIVPMGEDWHMLGDTQLAQAITVAFLDYASSESAQYALDVQPKLIDEYVDSGELIYVVHPWSEDAESPGAQAAAAAECAGQQGQFWEMNELLFENQETWLNADDPRSEFVSYAESLGLDTDEFETCLDSDWAALRVMSGSALSALYGIPGAPIYLFNNGESLDGSPTFEEFQTQIKAILGP